MTLVSWTILAVVVNARTLRSFFSSGLWSVAIALFFEGLIRRHMHYFNPEYLITPVFGTELLLFVGPRFVEGVIFMKMLQPGLQPFRIAAWSTGVLLAEFSLSMANFIQFSVEGFAVSWAIHLLRFTALLGIFYAFDYNHEKLMLEAEQQQKTKAKVALRASRFVWAMSWPLFWIGAGVMTRFFRMVNGERR